MSVVPATPVADGGRARAWWLARVTLVANLIIIMTFIALRLMMFAAMPFNARAAGYAVRDIAQWAFALELVVGALLLAARFARQASPALLLVALPMTGLALMELFGLHYRFEAGLVSRFAAAGAGGPWAATAGKFAVYAMIALLATAPALIALQLARRRDETIAVQRFLMFMLALACGSGATDTIAGIVKPLVDSGRGSLILMEMTGELMVTSFAVWLFADLLAMGDRVRNIIPEVRPLSFHPPAGRNARLLDCRSDPG